MWEGREGFKGRNGGERAGEADRAGVSNLIFCRVGNSSNLSPAKPPSVATCGDLFREIEAEGPLIEELGT